MTRNAQSAVQDPSRARCLHCDLPVGSSTHSPFCCSGCETVYEILNAEGLDRFYELRGGPGVPPPRRRKDPLTWLDPLLDAHVRPGGAVSTLTLDIQGIHCAACVWLLETTFKRRPWGVSLRINPALGRVELAWKSGEGDLREWLREVEQFGYTFGPPRKELANTTRGLLVRLGVTAAAATQVMMVSLAFHLGLAKDEPTLYTALGWIALALSTVTVAVGGPVFFRGAALGLKNRLAHLDLPISLGILLAYAGSVAAFFKYGPEHAYFDSLSVFLTLMLAGRWLQEHLLVKNRHSLLEDAGVQGLVTRRIRGDRIVPVSTEEIRVGDRLSIVPGDLVPVRSRCRDVPGRVSLDWITGESQPQEVGHDQEIQAGAFNVGAEAMVVEALEPFADSSLHELLSRVDRTSSQGPGSEWWNAVARWYAGVVLLLAAGALVLWIPQGLDKALPVVIAVLVVTCPCAFGLAVPLAYELVLLRLRRRGVFVKNSSFLDKATHIRKVVFDKTGTLTFGDLQLGADSMDALLRMNPEDRGALATMAASSNHPVSRAVLEAVAADRPIRYGRVEEKAGEGLRYQPNGVEYRMGSPRFALAEDRAGRDTTVFSRDRELVSEFELVEHIKSDAREEVKALTEDGVAVYLLSGDARAKVDRVALSLGIPAERVAATMSPRDKARWLSRLDARDTLMVGDGINDAPGFNEVYASATPAVEQPHLPARADFYFLGDRVAGVRDALNAGRRLRRVVKLNLITAIFYNLFAVTLSYLGLITPLLAAVLMPISSAGVVLLTTSRLRERSFSWRL